MRSAGVHDGEATRGPWPRLFPRDVLLLLIGESPCHGYDLLERLDELGSPPVDPGTLYRTLRALEREGLLESSWHVSTTGPARRVYRLSTLGHDRLGRWATQLADSRRLLSLYLDRYAALSGTRSSRR